MIWSRREILQLSLALAAGGPVERAAGRLGEHEIGWFGRHHDRTGKQRWQRLHREFRDEQLAQMQG